MAQWVKVFPAHTHEDLCLGSQHPHKSLIWGFSPITPAVRGGKERGGRCWELTGQPI